MKPVSLSLIAEWTGARLQGDDLVLSAVGIDTRTLSSDSLYVALRGEHFDGHAFCAEAEAAGARALMVERKVDSPLPQLRVENSQVALGRLAAGLASTRRTRVIALTGSNGKTTTRTLTCAILSRTEAGVYANPGNRNNEIGLPLALIDQPEDAVVAIYEMGAGAPGDIAYLAAIARPSIALVTNVAAAHLERMGSLEGIADTKAAIYEALPIDGTAVINGEDAFAERFAARASGRRILRYGLQHSADVRAEAIVQARDGSRFLLCSPWGEATIDLPLPGPHQILNALAAASLALAAGATLDEVTTGLAGAKGVAGRQQRLHHASGALLLDDSYNANPGSLAAAIDLIAARAGQDGGQAWLVLGDMRELGPQAGPLHAQAGLRARAAGITRLFAVGDLSAQAATAFGPGAEHFPDQEALIAALAAALAPGVTCLVKGSRGSRMDRVVAALAASADKEAGHAA